MNHNQKLTHLIEVYPDLAKQLFKYFKYQPVTLELFVCAVDKSDYSLTEWFDALDTMTEWLTKRDRVMSLTNKIQYLNCATEIMAKGAHWDNFATAIYSILEQYGCERSSDESNKNH